MTEHEHIELSFQGVMDQDTADEFIAAGDYREAYGIVNGTGSELGTVKLMKGNSAFGMTLPSGNNTVIGGCEDKRRQSYIFFVYNDKQTPDHTIWRWFPNEQDLDNPSDYGRLERLALSDVFHFQREWPIVHAELIDDKYLIWTDARGDKFGIQGNPPRKLDIEKASKYQKYKYYEMYAGLPGQGQFMDGTDLLLTVTEDDGTVVWPTTIFHTVTGFYNDPEGALEDIADALNTYCQANEIPVEAEYCGCKLEIRSQLVNLNINITKDVVGDYFILVPTNFYVQLEEDIISLVRPAPRFEPTVVYGTDPDVDYNYVTRSLFQFRIRYHFEDNSKSAWGPISEIPIPLDAAGNHLDSFNHILVDFTDDILNEQYGLTIIRKVEIAFRQGNEGLFKSSDIIDVCSIGITQNIYKFYNDKVYSTVASDDDSPSNVQALKLFDDVPLLSASLHTVSDKEGNTRLVLGNNQRRFDVDDCPDLRLETTTEAEGTCLINIKGKIIINHYDSDPYKFGALHSEHLALDGFVVYLAGTDYYGISDNFTVSPTGDFEIQNVPPGKYFMRVANYKCRFDDSQGAKHNLNNGREWQKTSSPVVDCAGSGVDTGVAYERYMDLTDVPGGDFDLMLDADYGPIVIENWDFNNIDYVGMECYLLDNDGDPSTNALRKASIGMERQRVDFRYNDGHVESPVTVELETDHNGYFWYTYQPQYDTKDEQYFGLFKAYVADACNPGDPVVELTTELYYVDGPYGGPPTTDYDDIWLALDTDTEQSIFNMNGLTHKILYYSSAFGLFNADPDVAASNKALITGTLKDSSSVGVEAVAVCLERNGRAEETDANGTFSIAVWLPYDSTDSYRSDDRLVYAYPADECYTHPPTPDEYTPEIGEFCAVIGDGTEFQIPDIVFPFSGALTLIRKYLKSGGYYQTGIVYEDAAGRKSTVVRGPDLYIPFHTEIGSYERPVVNWEIHHSPPAWADHYRIVRTKDGIYRRYFHWLVEEVAYVIINNVDDEPTVTTYGAGDSTHILLKISSEIDPDPSSQQVLFFFRDTNYFNFEPDLGDRVRIILDETGAVVGSGIFDFEIVGRYVADGNYYAVIKSENIGFEIENNFLVEFYTPNQLEEIVYYECGNTYRVLFAGDDPYHEGQTQDQIPGTQPATGRLKGGDTYWRDRNFTVSASISFTYNTENKNFSDSFDSEDEDIGRPNVYVPGFKQEYLFSELAMSDIYIPTTLLNGLPSFRPLEKLSVDRGYGPIRKLAVLGSTMLAICEYKTQPIYIGQGYIMSLEGNQQVVQADKILNIANQTAHDYGTQNPESVVVDNASVKGWDASKGTVWQYAQNGQVPITMKMVQFFNELGRQTDALYGEDPAYESMWCPASYDRERKLYILSFIHRDPREDIELYTCVYDDVKNGWSTFLPMFGEWYGRLGLWQLHFKLGEIWIGSQGDTCNFFGLQKTPSITIVANTAPYTTKDWHNIELLANYLWTATQITTPQNNIHLDGQLSRLKLARWSRYNGKWCADFMRDINDPAFDSVTPEAVRQATALMRGRVLKSNVITVKLVPYGNQTQDDPLDGSWLKIVSVEWTPAFDTK